MNKTNERLLRALRDAAINIEVACLAMNAAAQQLEDEEISRLLRKNIDTLRQDSTILRVHAREVSEKKIRRRA
ncbi:hypothetical protein D3C76_643740 [compost metagenome]|uniref:Uncharacterized protein n=1 Tax=Pseudomonas jinjuensis TaxID=198616 RepID=A0A1H0ECK7_9PSED|nr:hypothetical protein [Pseudomonas jinjuensis]SDN80070.1 hypothetical protein SAMN05216193_105122 [Pseudomonas jinjuensis]